MNQHDSSSKRVPFGLLTGTVLAALALWFFTFYLQWGNFWVKISISAGTLCITAVLTGRRRIDWRMRPVDLITGLGSAALLYLLFWVGNAVSARYFDFAPEQIGSIYDKGEGTPLWVICLLLLAVTSPAEEIYWRGFLQENLQRRFGGLAGWTVATACYTLVHLPAWNFMLIGAAAVAGAFWGLLYWKTRRIAPLIVSHAAWSVTIFALAPIR